MVLRLGAWIAAIASLAMVSILASITVAELSSGEARAINLAGSLRMQSYRLLAAVPLGENDQKLLDEMTATVFSPELQYAARHDDQQRQLQALQHYWQLELAPGMRRAQNQASVATDVAGFVDRIDQLGEQPGAGPAEHAGPDHLIVGEQVDVIAGT